mgnify:CR=1 FL=1
MYSGISKFLLLAIPFFILAGNIMEKAGISTKLIAFAQSFVGHVNGGLALVCVLVACFFAAISGSGPATVAALGGIIIPAMTAVGYSKGDASALMATAGGIGIIIPPSISFVVYSSIANVSVGTLFMAGIVPGLLMGFSLFAASMWVTRKSRLLRAPKASAANRWAAFKDAFWGLMIPVIILGGIYTGIFTPTEAAVTCVIYSLVLGIAYREMKFSDLISAMKKTIVTSGMVMFIMAMSANFGWILSAAKIPTTVANALVPYLGNRFVFTVLLLILLFIAGCFMEVLALVVILAPILIPIGVQLGMDPLHLGVTFCIALVMGLITPPFGMNLFTAAAVCDTTFVEIVKGALPYICVALIMISLFAFVPQITLFLPGLMAG